MRPHRSHSVFVRIALAVVAALPAAPVAAVEVGEPLPALDAITWIGDAPEIKGRVVLVDLWSPADDAFRATMPRLTDLQRRHPDALVIGLAAGDAAAARRCVDAMGSRVGYAIGTVTDLARFAPAVAGAPVTLLVDRSGTVRWWGDALHAAEPLVDGLQGRWPSEHREPPRSGSVPAQTPPAVVSTPRGQPERIVERVVEERIVVVEAPPPRTSVVVVGAPRFSTRRSHVWIDLGCSRPVLLPRPPRLLLPPLPFWHRHRHHHHHHWRH